MPERPYALVRRPAETLADGIVTFIERTPLDLDLAKRQWDGYVAALERNGWPTVVIDGDDSMPDCVFVEDTVVMFGDLAVITNPAAARSQSGDRRRPPNRRRSRAGGHGDHRGHTRRR